MQEQGVLQALSGWVPLPSVISYSQIQRRVNSLGLDIVGSLANPKDGRMLHVAVNIKTKQAVALGVTEDSVGDAKLAIPLVRQGKNLVL